MIEGRDYFLIENDLHSDHFSIQLAMKQYADVVYRYGTVRITEEDGRARLSFQYNIDSVPDNLCKESLEADEKFTNLLGDVLVNILENNDTDLKHGFES